MLVLLYMIVANVYISVQNIGTARSRWSMWKRSGWGHNV